MRYETFLFTRSRQRDFTAFVRPAGMSNKDVSVIANAFNYINDVTVFTPEWPGLYHFALGGHSFLLRHYDSGRRHAGREIGVIEGIAVPQEAAAELDAALPLLLLRQADLLHIAGRHGDIDALDITPSPEYTWNDDPDTPELSEPEMFPPLDDASRAALDNFAARHTDERLLLPHTPEGWALLLAALSDDRLPPLAFAFGSSSEVVASLVQAGVSIDVTGYRTTQQPGLKPREAARPAPAPAVPLPTPVVASPPPTEPARPRPQPRSSLVQRLVRWLLGQ